jgi:hypothetical protein
VIVVGNHSLAALELFMLPQSKDHTGPIPISKVGELKLPPLDEGCIVCSITFENVLVKDSVTRKRQTHDSAIFTKPFSSALSDIIFVSLLVMSKVGYNSVSFAVHSSTLLSHAPSSSHENLENMIPWHVWGPTSTRWFPCRLGSPNNICGQRCLLVGSPHGSREIWDFNPNRIRSLGQHFATESDTARVSVESDPSYITVPGLKEAVCSSLPFVKIVPKKWDRHEATCLDDDRIICMLPTVSCSHYLQPVF